jgi:excisionase family DNA binding protein
MTTLDDLNGCLWADVPKAADLLGLDERTVRRAAAAGEIPARKVGHKWMIPTAWLCEQAGSIAPTESALLDLDDLADRVADRVFARLAGLFAGRTGNGAASEAR